MTQKIPISNMTAPKIGAMFQGLGLAVKQTLWLTVPFSQPLLLI
jgi:hypothetical protein